MSVVVTGAGRGIGRVIAERLLAGGDVVVALDMDEHALAWVDAHPAGDRVRAVAGTADDPEIAERAAGLAEEAEPLTGWVNNAAVFRDLTLHAVAAAEVLQAISANLAPVLVGCHTAVRRFLVSGGGSIVNISSHQAQRPVRGALAYSTAKAAIEGLTRSVAVDYGPAGIRCNAVALGSVTTQRYEDYLAGLDEGGRQRVRREMADLHPLGRVGLPQEVAEAVAFLLDDRAGFINGAVLPVDGGRSAQGRDPEEW